MKKIISVLFLAVCFIGLSSYSAEAKPIQINIETSSEAGSSLNIGMVEKYYRYVSKTESYYDYSFYNMYDFTIVHSYEIFARDKNGNKVVIKRGSLTIPAKRSKYVTVRINSGYSNYGSRNLGTKRY